jgi:hypothetical protein
VDIRDLLRAVQNGQVYANLARAFHLAPTKVEVAVDVMLDDLIGRTRRNLRARHSLANVVELLGQNGYEQVLDQPSLIGATHTQVIGNEALNVLAGRGESHAITRSSAAAAEISEMIAEYLLPVVAALFVGALARLSRSSLETLAGYPEGAADAAQPVAASQDLPLAGGGAGFSGSTGATFGPLNTIGPSRYLVLSESINRADGRVAALDPAVAVRKVLASNLGYAASPLDWIARAHRWGIDAIGKALASLRR